MNNLKRKISLILSVIMIALVICPLAISSASTDSKYVEMSVKLDGKELEYGATYDVKGGEKVKVSASSKNAPIAFISYYFENENDSDAAKDSAYKNRTKVKENSITITIPVASVGTEKILWVEAVDSEDNGVDNLINKTGWQGYILKLYLLALQIKLSP